MISPDPNKLVELIDRLRDPNDCNPYDDGGHIRCAEHNDEILPCPHAQSRAVVRAQRRFYPEYVYVASSWRNPMQPAVVAALTAAGIDHYDFRNPPRGTGFSWREVRPDYDGPNHHTEIRQKGADWEPVDTYLQMISHPRAIDGYESDYHAMQRADTFVMVLPCGKSAHLELGWAVGAGKRTAILLEDPVEPELMYRMVDYLAPTLHDLLGWLGVD